eukprot:Sspe_Gene.115823::Locus_103958_Transcript_1_1_Confidence_1.000_Length_1742::g.115823::m.115823
MRLIWLCLASVMLSLPQPGEGVVRNVTASFEDYGNITFTEDGPNSTTITATIQLPDAMDWYIYQLPGDAEWEWFPVNTPKCNRGRVFGGATGSTGDLKGRLGKLKQNGGVYTGVADLPLRGRHSIVGRSLVLLRQGTVWGCALIGYQGEVTGHFLNLTVSLVVIHQDDVEASIYFSSEGLYSIADRPCNESRNSTYSWNVSGPTLLSFNPGAPLGPPMSMSYGNGTLYCDDLLGEDECRSAPCGRGARCRDPEPLSRGNFLCRCHSSYKDSKTVTRGQPILCEPPDETHRNRIAVVVLGIVTACVFCILIAVILRQYNTQYTYTPPPELTDPFRSSYNRINDIVENKIYRSDTHSHKLRYLQQSLAELDAYNAERARLLQQKQEADSRLEALQKEIANVEKRCVDTQNLLYELTGKEPAPLPTVELIRPSDSALDLDSYQFPRKAAS